MFVSKARKPQATAPHRHYADPDTALDILFPIPSPSLPSAGYQLAQKFISNLRKDSINNEVLELISRDGDAFLERYRKQTVNRDIEQNSLQNSMKFVVDQAFGSIEPYIAELNEALGRNELRVASTPPEWVTENFREYGGCTRKTYYRARISTSRFSIVIRGAGGKIEFFMLPASLVMGLSQSEDRQAPLMVFEGHNASAHPMWEVEGKPLTHERMERYCLLFFNYLLEETKRELTDLFVTDEHENESQYGNSVRTTEARPIDRRASVSRRPTASKHR